MKSTTKPKFLIVFLKELRETLREKRTLGLVEQWLLGAQ